MLFLCLGIFEIKYLTSDEKAIRAALVDYEQLLQITKDLSINTSIKREKRKEILQLHHKLKNSENFVVLLSLKSALETVISPYQCWSQKRECSAAERKFNRDVMYKKIRNLNQTKALSNDIETHLEKINFAVIFHSFSSEVLYLFLFLRSDNG